MIRQIAMVRHTLLFAAASILFLVPGRVAARADTPVPAAELAAAPGSRTPGGAHQADGPRVVDELVRQYAADAESIAEFYQVPVYAARAERLEDLYRGWKRRLAAVPFQSLGPADRLDYVLLENELRAAQAALERTAERTAEIASLIPFCAVIEELERARWKAGRVDGLKAANQLNQISEQVKKLRERVERAARQSKNRKDATAEKEEEKEPESENDSAEPLSVSPALALRAAERTKELTKALKEWHDFYAGYQPQFDWWVGAPFEQAQRELAEYEKLLREEMAEQKGKAEDPLVGDPIGAPAVADEIAFAFLPYTAEELIAIGERELSWCEGEMRKAAREMGLGDDWKAALEKVKGEFVSPGEQDQLIARLGREATQFVEKRHLITVPPLCRETWRLTMISPELMKTIPYAAYNDQHMMVAYAKDSMNQDDKLMAMRGNNRHFMRLVTPHELIPGHHLQRFYAARHNTHRELFSTPFYVEGWALYWELRLWDLGWSEKPEDRIGMLFWRMTRAARIIVSLKYHLGQMDPKEMVAFLMDRVGHERLGATSEVRRFIKASPLYQVGYLTGGLQLYALWQETVAAGKMTEREFHDRVLVENTMPIELLRARVLGLQLSPEMKPCWRFAEKIERLQTTSPQN
ncbi:MAG: DUF885 family protein [Planctomycetota bacterium]